VDAGASGGLWATVYVVVPPAMLLVLWLQSRQRGADPARRFPVTASLRRLVAAGGIALLVGGAILLVAPAASSWLWPWTLGDLTARAYGAWLVGFGVAMIQIVGEADWRRVRAATLGAGALGALQLMALLSYLDVPDWASPQPWAYAAVLVVLVLLAVRGWRETADAD
jgi:hypothetical protein